MSGTTTVATVGQVSSPTTFERLQTVGGYFVSGDSHGAWLNSTLLLLFGRAVADLTQTVSKACSSVSSAIISKIDFGLGFLSLQALVKRDIPVIANGVSRLCKGEVSLKDEHGKTDWYGIRSKGFDVLCAVKNLRWPLEALDNGMRLGNSAPVFGKIPSLVMLSTRLSYWSINILKGLNGFAETLSLRKWAIKKFGAEEGSRLTTTQLVSKFVINFFTTSDLYDAISGALSVTAVASGQFYILAIAAAISNLLSALFDFGHSTIDYHKEVTTKAQAQVKVESETIQEEKLL